MITKLEIETNIETTVNGTGKKIIQKYKNNDVIRIFFGTYAVVLCTKVIISSQKPKYENSFFTYIYHEIIVLHSHHLLLSLYQG